MKETLDQRVIDEVYLRRARQLAQRQNDDAASTTMAVLVFGLGTERYGIELSALTEVFPYRGCTAVPGSPSALLGVMNVRGDIRPLADLRRILGLPPGDDRAAGYVVTVRHQERNIGLRVETIDEVRQIDPSQLVSAGSGAAPIPGCRFVKALTADTVILIDTSAALSGLGLASRESDLERV
jgi:chemotaxis signal transduction protein